MAEKKASSWAVLMDNPKEYCLVDKMVYSMVK